MSVRSWLPYDLRPLRRADGPRPPPTSSPTPSDPCWPKLGHQVRIQEVAVPGSIYQPRYTTGLRRLPAPVAEFAFRECLSQGWFPLVLSGNCNHCHREP